MLADADKELQPEDGTKEAMMEVSEQVAWNNAVDEMLAGIYKEIADIDPWTEDDYGRVYCFFCDHDFSLPRPIPPGTVGVGFGFTIPSWVKPAADKICESRKHHNDCLWMKANSWVKELSDAAQV